MKVVLNRCFGGFGLSKKAEDLYAEKSGFKLWRYTQTQYSWKQGADLYERDTDDENFYSHTYTKDLGDSFSSTLANDDSYWSYYNLERTDPILVEVVEELGSEVASGRCASLDITEIPDDIEWHIHEYDGQESIHEDHRSW